jgi:hypothetical protein
MVYWYGRFALGVRPVMDTRHRIVGPFRLDWVHLQFHNHRLDPATKGRHLMRLRDRTLCDSTEYEARRGELEARWPAEER